jgi:hypothetical protein
LWTLARTEANFCRLFIFLNRNITACLDAAMLLI